MRVSQREIYNALDVLAESSATPEKLSAVERLLARTDLYPAPRRELVCELKQSLQEQTYDVPSEDVAHMILVHCLLLGQMQ